MQKVIIIVYITLGQYFKSIYRFNLNDVINRKAGCKISMAFGRFRVQGPVDRAKLICALDIIFLVPILNFQFSILNLDLFSLALPKYFPSSSKGAPIQ